MIYIRIGELQVVTKGRGIKKYIELSVKDIRDVGEPYVKYFEGNRAVDTIAWDDVVHCINSDITSLMNDVEYGLLRNDYAVPITKQHKHKLDEYYNVFKSRYPDAIPNSHSDSRVDVALAVLEWLKFWIDWALKNCKVPVVYKSDKFN